MQEKANTLLNTKTFKRTFYFLVLLLSLSPNPSLADESACRGYYSGPTLDARKKNLSAFTDTLSEFLTYAEERNPISKQSTFFLGTNTFGLLEFLKPHDMPWPSFFDTIPNGQAPQGDIRWPIAILGARLAQKFKIKIQVTPNGMLVHFPNATLLKKIVDALNIQLKKDSKSPVGLLPVKAKYLNAEEMLKLSVSAKGDYVTLFPFADQHPLLTLHEVAWHLAAMLFPRSFHEKSVQITRETLKMVKRIRASNIPGSEDVAQALMNQRSYELDVGNANMPATVADFFMANGNVPPSEIAKRYISPSEPILTSIDLLLRPGYSPSQAVARMFFYLTGLRGTVATPKGFERPIKSMVQSEENPNKVALNERQKRLYADLLNDYMTTGDYTVLPPSDRKVPRDLIRQFVTSLEEKRLEWEEAFEKIHIPDEEMYPDYQGN